MKKLLIFVLVAAAIAAIVIGVMRRGEEATPRSIEQIHAAEGVPVDVETVRAGTVTTVRRVTGTVMGLRQSTLRAAAPQKISRVLVREGQRVSKGQPLARFDTEASPDRMARYRQIKETYDNATRSVGRLEPLFEQGAVSESELDAARTQLAITRADLRNARLELEVAATIDGVVTLMAVRAGDALDVGDVIAQVAVLDSVRVVADVSGTAAHEIERGDTARINGAVRGRIARVSLAANPDTRLFRVEAVLGNADPGAVLKPGESLTIDVETDRVGPVTVVPDVAIQGEGAFEPGGNGRVYWIDGSTAKLSDVVVGQRSGGIVEIRSGLDDGDRVVTFGANRLKDGLLVRLHRVDGKLVEPTAGETAKGASGR